MSDNKKINVGDNDDISIYHDGTDSYITNKTGSLKKATETADVDISVGHSSSEISILGSLNTKGISNSTGEILLTGGNLQLNDSISLSFGTDDDLNMSHNGSDFLIQNTLEGGNITIDNQDADKKIIMILGTDTNATSFEVQNNSNNTLFSVTGDGNATLSGDLTVSEKILHLVMEQF